MNCRLNVLYVAEHHIEGREGVSNVRPTCLLPVTVEEGTHAPRRIRWSIYLATNSGMISAHVVRLIVNDN